MNRIPPNILEIVNKFVANGKLSFPEKTLSDDEINRVKRLATVHRYKAKKKTT